MPVTVIYSDIMAIIWFRLHPIPASPVWTALAASPCWLPWANQLWWIGLSAYG